MQTYTAKSIAFFSICANFAEMRCDENMAENDANKRLTN